MRRRLLTLAVLPVLLVPAASDAATWPDEPPKFSATVQPIGNHLRDWMTGRSWHEGCPVGFDRLRVLRLRYWGFDGRAQWGRLVVNRAFAWPIVRVFQRLYRHRRPVHRMWLVDRYGADDLRSMEHDNTSAFNCRWRAGQPGLWSMHAYGKAVDVPAREPVRPWRPRVAARRAAVPRPLPAREGHDPRRRRVGAGVRRHRVGVGRSVDRQRGRLPALLLEQQIVGTGGFAPRVPPEEPIVRSLRSAHAPSCPCKHPVGSTKAPCAA